jgi:hypothetical protein
METKAIVLQPLGGIDQRWAKDQRHANQVQDLTWDGPKGAWATAGGYRRLIVGESNPFTGIGVVSSVFSFTQHNGARNWLIYEAQNGNLYQFNPSTAARSSSPGDVGRDRGFNLLNDRAYLSTPWQKSQGCTYGDNFYIVNGINRPMVFTGYYWDYAGFSVPAGVPTASALSHPGAFTGDGTTGTRMNYIGLGPVSNLPADAPDYICGYRYRIQYVNNRGIRSPVSEPSDTVTFENGGGPGLGAHFVWLSVPTGGPETVARIVWRTQNIYDSNGDPVLGYADQFYYHSTILDNMVTGVCDGRTDMDLGELLDLSAYGPWPTNTKYISPFKGTMFAAGVSEATLFYSAPLQPENFPPDNVIDLGDANLGPITGLYPTRNALVVFKQRGIQLIKGDPTTGFYAQILTRDVGCAAPNTVKDVPGVGLCFLSEAGIFAMQGALENEGVPTRVIPLHVPIGEWILKLNRAALIGACGAVYHTGKEYWLAVPTIGSDTNNLVLVYHYEAGEWSTRENFPINCMVETNDHRGTLIFGSWDTATEGLMVYSRGWADKGGTSIEPLYQTGWVDAGGVFRSIVPKGVEVRIGLHGDNTVNMDVTTNRQNDVWPEQPAMAAQYPEDPQPIFGVATFDSGTEWQALRPGTLRWSIAAPQKAEVHEVAYTLTPTSHWLTVAAVAAELDTGAASLWKPITTQNKAGR